MTLSHPCRHAPRPSSHATGKNQIYGSQLRSDPKTGKIELYPIDDPEHVDERRAKVGLPPLQGLLEAIWTIAVAIQRRENARQSRTLRVA